jgi:hypothetical protein
VASEGHPLDFKRISNFLRKIMIQEHNIYCLLSEALSMLAISNDKFENEYSLPYTTKHRPEWFKHQLIDSFFSVLIDQRIALPILFHGCWSQTTQSIVPDTEVASDCVRVIELILQVLLFTPEKTSTFLKMSLDYVGCLNKTSRFGFPYLDIQDSIPLSRSLAEHVSQQLRANEQSFSDNPKILLLFNFMSYLQLSMLKIFLEVELTKMAETVSRVCEK